MSIIKIKQLNKKFLLSWSKRTIDLIFGVPLIFLLGFLKSPLKTNFDRPIQKIVVIKLAAVGDTILLISVFEALKKALPRAQIDFVCSSVNAPIARLIPQIDHLTVIKKFSLPYLFRLIRKLKNEQYDIAFDLEQWARGTALIAFLSGAKITAGFDTPGQCRGKAFFRVLKKRFNQHEISDFYDIISLIIPLKRDLQPNLRVTEKGKQELSAIIPCVDTKNNFKDFSILIHPGCGGDGKPREWPMANYAELINWIKGHYSVKIFLSAGPDEIDKTKILAELSDAAVIDLGGRLSWEGTIALVDRTDLVISGNTGIMHIAAAFNKYQVALHGPTNPKLWGPLNPKAVVIQSKCEQCPCLNLGFEYHTLDDSCMKKIDKNEVKQSILKIMDKLIEESEEEF